MTKKKMISKKYTGILLMLALMIMPGVMNVPVQTKAESRTESEKFENGITLDCARHYYSVDDLKKYIELLGENPNSFLQLHFTDNENVGIECRNLNQTPENATKAKDGSYINKSTGKKFLSDDQVKELLSYAKEKNVEIIPEIDTPAHMGGFFTLSQKSKGRGFTKKIEKNDSDGELDLDNKDAVLFAKNLYLEYAEIFSGCRYFHMGCDEMESGSDAEKIGYITDVSRLLQERGYTVRIWNDLITKKNLDKLPAGIQVTYWSYDGDTEDKDEKKERRSERASMPDLIQAKIPVLNYNSYYLYYIPSARDTRKDKEYMVNDIKENWNRYVWDQEKQSGIRENEYIIGSSISVWGENASKVSNKAIYKQTRLQYLAMKKAH